MPDFSFRESDHTYWLDGVQIPSVSAIKKPVESFDGIPADILQRAADFGRAVHKTVELYLADDLDEDDLDENLSAPLEAFKKWQASSDGQHLFGLGIPVIETPMYHPRLKYGFTPDLVFPGATVDIKSRPFDKITDPVQLAAYNEGVKAQRVFGAEKQRAGFILELRRDGAYRFTKISNPQALPMFRLLLDHHHNLQTIEKWRKQS